ncbi:MAG: Hpt domain-containing protein [Pseudomonadota bacterium]|jgi:HPt (histidine-containing phosphotransfer) domain-containing protein|nr:Hpt domain-containing protein [Rubrivivax sp.]MCA3257387.1 Hpt domain-containing protein [Rubrivivax sp.]MCE2910945.1 Hpt domain-containing protein [Rubrivivax sp.]MCZ8031877.1 Hpt domain-containing protein [Rubrivivax sp.]
MTSKTLIDPQTFGELQANAGADFVVELVDTFATEAPTLVAEMRAALAAGAAERFRRAAHSLKSNSNTFGAGVLAEQARALELGGLPADAAPLDALKAELERSVAALRDLARG